MSDELRILSLSDGRTELVSAIVIIVYCIK